MKRFAVRLIRVGPWVAGLAIWVVARMAVGADDTPTGAVAIYGISMVSPGPSGPVVFLQKMRAEEGHIIVRTENYAAAAMLPAAPGEGVNGSDVRLRFDPPRRLLSDEMDVYSRIVPVRGTALFVQVKWKERGQTEIFVLGPKPDDKRRLASFPVRYKDPADGAYAVTRSGRYALLASAERVCVWDVVEWKELDRNTGPLGSLLKAMIQEMGNPGIWWLTDDLRYIVVACPEGWTETGLSVLKDHIPVQLGAATVDVVYQGAVFDRKTGNVSTFPIQLWERLFGLFVADAESVGGNLTLLYVHVGTPLTVTITDGTGRVTAEHAIKEPPDKDWAGWDPQREEVYMKIRDADGSHPAYMPNADDHLVIWDVAKDRERRIRVPVDQIRRAIDQAKHQ